MPLYPDFTTTLAIFLFAKPRRRDKVDEEEDDHDDCCANFLGAHPRHTFIRDNWRIALLTLIQSHHLEWS